MQIGDRQSAYHIERAAQTRDVDRDIQEAMRLYLTRDLGIDENTAATRAVQELKRSIAVGVIDSIEQIGVKIPDLEVLDVGSGLGAASEELILRGAKVTALEPGAAWASLTLRRVSRHGGSFRLLQGVGEAIPLPSSSVDLVVSLQVLEHTQRPREFLSEVWRVLRPGGHFYLACENYLAFRECHYRVPWLPLMPKWLGSIYLRLLGRDPTFLRESVTYVTYPGILRICRRIGFSRHRDTEFMNNLATKRDLKWRAMRVLARISRNAGPLWLDRMRLTFKLGVYEIFSKPF